ncbi:uracil-DNA glycosylase family protein [Synechocystis sp. CACIAM 05]|uniref:uracil-DNA glycosylase family protein n=1 Tax=Synechocystis sp. CACIAM 05 TaxID=1933929 RepID=UPI00138E7F59|nr:uracil-DNA glycosylase family protein [Synechocystis sp. CACIAM 05]QHU99947.1 uracil-DNA glycosylase [Synechocystis sp. CACIAM 05]
MSELQTLIRTIRQEAEREPFPLDSPIYEQAGKDALDPILFGGNLGSQLCFFGRDLGADEVRQGQPLIGAAGRLVRKGFFEAWQGRLPRGQDDLQTVCQRILLTNTVPYKPPENKAYSVKVKERFRPFVEQLLVFHWRGKQIITLGTEAFKWFAPYAPKGQLDEFFQGGDRYERSLDVLIKATTAAGKSSQKIVKLMPLPHPSPLNKRYYGQFPTMLQRRLTEIAF